MNERVNITSADVLAGRQGVPWATGGGADGPPIDYDAAIAAMRRLPIVCEPDCQNPGCPAKREGQP